MACDDHTITYHLTPRGWETGDPPSDHMETWSRSVSQASGWSKEYISWVCEWVDPDALRADRDALRHEHREFMGKAGQLGDRITTIGEPL